MLLTKRTLPAGNSFCQGPSSPTLQKILENQLYTAIYQPTRRKRIVKGYIRENPLPTNNRQWFTTPILDKVPHSTKEEKGPKVGEEEQL